MVLQRLLSCLSLIAGLILGGCGEGFYEGYDGIEVEDAGTLDEPPLLQETPVKEAAVSRTDGGDS